MFNLIKDLNVQKQKLSCCCSLRGILVFKIQTSRVLIYSIDLELSIHIKRVILSHDHAGFWIRIDLMRIRIRIRILIFSNCLSGLRVRVPDPDPGFDDLKLKKIYSWKLISIFLIKNCNLLIPRPP